jgi:hypothetical protein
MQFAIRMGIPEMDALWNGLVKRSKDGTISKEDAELYKKWGKALSFLANNPKHPGLQSHEIDPLSHRYGIKVWQSYLENNTPAAGRFYWVYGPDKGNITIIGLEPHPEDKKSAGYAKVKLSAIGKEI